MATSLKRIESHPVYTGKYDRGGLRYRIDLTARESSSPNPMITVSSNNQTIGVILVFIGHLLIGFVCGQTVMHTVYNKRRQ